jgi:electron transfer flavoprotein beta subunit
VRIICPVKRVPDTAADKKIADDKTVDRDASEPVLNANDEWSIEEAMRIKERDGAEVVALCMGPDAAQQTVRKALSYGLDAAIQITDDAIAGSDAYQTAKVLAKALKDEEYDLIIMGNQSSDARTTLVPAMLAEFLGIPALTYCKKLDIADGKATAERETPTGHQVVEAQLPVVVSVVEAINEPRYPSFKGIMAAKSKPLTRRASATSGSTRARSVSTTRTPRSSRSPRARRSRPARRSRTTVRPASARRPSPTSSPRRSSSRQRRERRSCPTWRTSSFSSITPTGHPRRSPTRSSPPPATSAPVTCPPSSSARARPAPAEKVGAYGATKAFVWDSGEVAEYATEPRRPPSSPPSRRPAPTCCSTPPTRSSPTSSPARRCGSAPASSPTSPTSSSTGTPSSRPRTSSAAT